MKNYETYILRENIRDVLVFTRCNQIGMHRRAAIEYWLCLKSKEQYSVKIFYIMNDTKIIYLIYLALRKKSKAPISPPLLLCICPKISELDRHTRGAIMFHQDFVRHWTELSWPLAAFSHAGKAAVSTDCYRRWAPLPLCVLVRPLPSRELISGHWKGGFSVDLHRLVILP